MSQAIVVPVYIDYRLLYSSYSDLAIAIVAIQAQQNVESWHLCTADNIS